MRLHWARDSSKEALAGIRLGTTSYHPKGLLLSTCLDFCHNVDSSLRSGRLTVKTFLGGGSARYSTHHPHHHLQGLIPTPVLAFITSPSGHTLELETWGKAALGRGRQMRQVPPPEGTALTPIQPHHVPSLIPLVCRCEGGGS